MGRKSTIDKIKVIELFKEGMTYRAIASKLGSNEDTIRMVIKRNAKNFLEERKLKRKKCVESKNDGLELEQGNTLTIKDRKELSEERTYGLNTNESIGDYAFYMMNRQSYKKKGKKLTFDERRGTRTYAVPKSY